MLEQRADGDDKGFFRHAIEVAQRGAADDTLDDAGDGGDVLDAAKLGGVVTDAVLAGSFRRIAGPPMI